MSLSEIAIVCALAITTAGFLRRAVAWWRGMPQCDRRRSAAGLLAASIAATAWIVLTRHTPLRGGYDNDNDFLYLSAQAGSLGHGAFSGKEASPQLLFWLVDRISDGSLGAILAAQKLLAAISSLLLFALLRRLRHGLLVSLLTAAALFFSFPMTVVVYGFSTTPGNIFFLISALFAMAPFLASDPEESGSLPAAELGASFFLLWTARYELLPPLVLGLVLALLPRVRSKLRLTARERMQVILIVAAWMAAAGAWAVELMRRTHYNGPHPELSVLFNLPRNLAHHIGENFLTPLTGLPPFAAAVIAMGTITAGYYLARKRRDDHGRWALFLAVWGTYAGIIYVPLELYPLHFVRHDLYVLLPLILLAALLLDEWAQSRRLSMIAVLCGILLYSGLNLRRLTGLNAQQRTNDKEWQFLYEASVSWPAGCSVAAALGYNRTAVLSKYFPSSSSSDGTGCRLIYRSPNYQVLRFPNKPPLRPAETMLGAPVLETTIQHRFYTIWHGPEHQGYEESLEPKQLRFGFYRFVPPAQGTPAAMANYVLLPGRNP